MMNELIVEPICGLSNRLQGLVSTIRLAHISQRRLRIIWGNFHPAQIKHSAGRLVDILESTFDEVDGGWPTIRFEGPVVSVCNGPEWIDWEWGPMPPDPWRSGNTVRSTECGGAATLCIVTKGPVLLDGEHFGDLEPELAAIFCGLRPSEFIRHTVTRFMEENWRDNVLGVHIRRGDLVDLATRRGKQLARIDDYCVAIDDKLSAGFERIYVASDDAAVWSFLLQRYGHIRCMRYDVRSLDRSQAHAVQDAFIELLLLSKARHIVGTRYSSFSRMAAWPKLSRGGSITDHLSVIRPSAPIQ